MTHSFNDLITLFNNLYQNTEQTILVSGGKEPLYSLKSNTSPFHRIIFRDNYFSSALHEIAHWCIAGAARRQLEDYGYWYTAERTSTDQHLFEQIEVKPQAIEWIFSAAAGVQFNVSLDNFQIKEVNPNFKLEIYTQVIHYLQHGLPTRAEQFKNKLLEFYGRNHLFNKELFT